MVARDAESADRVFEDVAESIKCCQLHAKLMGRAAWGATVMAILAHALPGCRSHPARLAFCYMTEPVVPDASPDVLLRIMDGLIDAALMAADPVNDARCRVLYLQQAQLHRLNLAAALRRHT